jgi:hypothetical protein
MSETAQDLEPENEILGGRTAFVLGTILVVGIGILSIFAYLDVGNRTKLETLANPTALDDPVTFVLPKGAGEPALTVHGQKFYAGVPDKHRELEMFKAGTDDSGRVKVYEFLKRGEERQPGLWVRLSEEEYVPLVDKPVTPKEPAAAK